MKKEIFSELSFDIQYSLPGRILSDIYTEIRRFPECFSRSIKWFFRMYHNHNWDYRYLYHTMYWKIKDIRNSIDKYGHHLYKKRDVFIMDIALNHLDNILDEFKCIAKLLDLHKEKYGDFRFNKETLPDGNVEIKGYIYSKCINYLEGLFDIEKNNHANEVSSRINRIQRYRSEKHKKKFWYIMEKYSETWWD